MPLNRDKNTFVQSFPDPADGGDAISLDVTSLPPHPLISSTLGVK
jgi:hypothetical protein